MRDCGIKIACSVLAGLNERAVIVLDSDSYAGNENGALSFQIDAAH